MSKNLWLVLLNSKEIIWEARILLRCQDKTEDDNWKEKKDAF